MDAPAEIQRIERDLAFQQRVWVAERVGWIGMAALVLAALAGLFGGGGPLAEAVARQDGIEVSWARSQRLGRVVPLAIAGTPDALRLDPGFAALWRLRDATPNAAAAPVTLHVEPIGAPGPRRLRFAVGATAFDLPVFVWP